jgi:hypothetical protein
MAYRAVADPERELVEPGRALGHAPSVAAALVDRALAEERVMSNSKVFLSAQVPIELREELEELARLHDRSLSGEIRQALRTHLDHRPAQARQPVGSKGAA